MLEQLLEHVLDVLEHVGTSVGTRITTFFNPEFLESDIWDYLIEF